MQKKMSQKLKSYIGNYSKVTKNKINKLFKMFCKENVSINLVFALCNVKSYFSVKDAIPLCFKSGVAAPTHTRTLDKPRSWEGC